MDKKEILPMILPTVVSAAVIFAVVFTAWIFKGGTESYRSIRVVELEGDVSIDREGAENLTAFENMNLISGDRISTSADAYVVLRLDEDKYIMLGEQGAIQILASGNAADGRTEIHLEMGTIVNNIQNPLSQDSSYEIVTPSATMSVRGTVFEVRWYPDDAVGELLTYEGAVALALTNNEPALYSHGEYSQFTGGDAPQFLVEREAITDERMNLQMFPFLYQIDENERDLDFGDGNFEELAEQVREKEPLAVADEQIQELRDATVLVLPKTKKHYKKEPMEETEEILVEEVVPTSGNMRTNTPVDSDVEPEEVPDDSGDDKQGDGLDDVQDSTQNEQSAGQDNVQSSEQDNVPSDSQDDQSGGSDDDQDDGADDSDDEDDETVERSGIKILEVAGNATIYRSNGDTETLTASSETANMYLGYEDVLVVGTGTSYVKLEVDGYKDVILGAGGTIRICTYPSSGSNPLLISLKNGNMLFNAEESVWRSSFVLCFFDDFSNREVDVANAAVFELIVTPYGDDSLHGYDNNVLVYDGSVNAFGNTVQSGERAYYNEYSGFTGVSDMDMDTMKELSKMSWYLVKNWGSGLCFTDDEWKQLKELTE